MRAHWLLLALIIIAPVSAMATEPTGFDQFDFGISRAALGADPAFLARCQPMRTGGGDHGARITCPSYALTDFGVVRVALLFSAQDRLVGYVMFVARDQRADVRAKVEARFGPPTSKVEQDQTLTWRWPSGTEASLTNFCRGKDGCVTVRALPPVTR